MLFFSTFATPKCDFKWVIRHLTPLSILIYYPNEVQVTYKRPKQSHFKILTQKFFVKKQLYFPYKKLTVCACLKPLFVVVQCFLC